MYVFRSLCRQLWLVGFIVAVLGASGPAAQAWWGTGHKHITVGAISHLPRPLRGFFEANLTQVRDRYGFEPPGQHYIDIDVYPEFFAGTFPRNIDDLIAIYGSSIVAANGRGPWTFANYVEDLSEAMMAAESPADWVALIPIAAAQAHYIEDLHNPLHLTANYDGQLTGNQGIHARYEGAMIERHLDELTFTTSTAEYLPLVIDFVFDGIDEHYHYVDDIMAADDLHPLPYNDVYYDGLWAETGSFTRELFQQASEAVASSWYTAWINAGSPRTFLEFSADFSADGQVDGTDLTDWQKAYRTSSAGDADADGDTDGQDFLAWQRQYGSGVGSSVAQVVVPEPATYGAGLVMLVTFVIGRRCRSSTRFD